MEITKEVTERFADFLFDWDHEQYLLLGGYGSGKSYHVALKIILKCLQEKRKVLVVRETYETLKESCFDLIDEILEDMNLVETQASNFAKKRFTKVQRRLSPLQFVFPNGSRIIFKGMDNPGKLKSIHGVSIVWIEECSEVKYEGYKELLGRVRTPDVSLHFILSTNPVGYENWVYSHFFKRQDENGKDIVIVDEEELYEKRELSVNGVYYHHSLPDDNPFLPLSYLRRLDEIRSYDYNLWRVARLGRFGANGIRVLPQFEVAKNPKEFKAAIRAIPEKFKFNGLDWGFEESYNALVRVAVDDEKKILYIYDEYYKNKMTDDKTAEEFKELGYDKFSIVADSEDPKAIQYFRQMGFTIRGAKKFAGSRLSNTRKIKRFKKIICSPKCKNTIRELQNLTYKRDAQGNAIYDEFNIDPHTFSAIWYALDRYTVADLKERKFNSRRGAA